MRKAKPKPPTAIELWRQRCSFEDIGEQLELKGGALEAFKLISKELRKARRPAITSGDVKAVLDGELQQLEAMEDALMPWALGLMTIDGCPDQSSVDRVLQIKKRRASYLGLDASQKREVNVSGAGFILTIGSGGVTKTPKGEGGDIDV